MAKKYNTVSAAVDAALSDIGETSPHRYLQFLGWALWGLREFHLDKARNTEHVILEMSPTKVMQVPPDYVDWVRLGVFVNGEPVLFSRDAGTFGANFKKVLGRPYSNFFTYDQNTGELAFTSHVDTSRVWLEYLTDGTGDCCAETAVSPYILEYLRCYCHWRRVTGDDKAPQVLKDEKGLDLHFARKNANSRISQITPEEMLDALRK